MKFLFTLLFLGVGLLALWLGQKMQGAFIGVAMRRRAAQLMAYLLSILIVILYFVQYWLLTRMFPLQFIAVLLGFSLLALLLSTIVRALAGLGTAENQEKVLALNAIWGFERGASNPLIFIATGICALLVILATWVACLWVYWRHPVGAPEAKVWIALFIFAPLLVVNWLVTLLISWPAVTSEALDNDLRNFHLIARFAEMLNLMIWLLFPVWMLKQEVTGMFQALPPLWAILAIPVLLFAIGGLLPYVIGIFRFQSNRVALQAWRRRWLQGLLEIVKLPLGSARTDAVQRKIGELDARIEAKAAGNNLIRLYRDVLDVGDPLEANAGGAPALLPPPEPARLTSGLMRRPEPTNEERMLEYINQHRQHLSEWDLRFAELKEMLSLRHIGSTADTADLGPFIETQIKGIDQESRAAARSGGFLPKALPGALASVLSSVLLGALKTYDAQISKFLSELLKGSA